MSLGLANSKFAMGTAPQRMGLVSRKHRVSVSIAEGAIFIPKPHKRVSFDMNLPGRGPLPTLGSGKVNVADSMTKGELGNNGLTERFDFAAHTGAPQGYVKMNIDYTPDKRGDVIVTQEEGRQVNNAAIHFTQQYDSYGRPRIGFSREPYDFAATKFVSVTNQIAFQQNTSKTREQFNAYLLNGTGAEEDEPQVMGQEGPKSYEVPIFGASSGDSSNLKANFNGEEHFLGPKPGNLGFNEVSAEDSFEAQQVQIVKTFGDGSSGGDHSVALPGSGGAVEPAATFGEIDTEELKTLDVSA